MPSADFTVGVQKAKVQRVGIGFDLSGKRVYQDLELLKREITELQSESKAGMPKGSL
jgi:hypothetical protein